MLTLELVASSKITQSLVPSRAKSSEQGNSHVYAVCDRLGEIRISAKLLSEANEDESLDDAVEVAFHGEPSVARESLSPAAKLPPGVCWSVAPAGADFVH